MLSHQHIRLFIKVLTLTSIIIMLNTVSPLYAETDRADTLPSQTSQPIAVPNLGTDLWRAVRQQENDLTGTTQMKAADAATLIHASAQKWRIFRMERLIPISMILLIGILLLLMILRLTTGGMKLKKGRSGIKVPRFNLLQRIVHWSVALLFVLLGITGIILTFGRSGLIPIIGNEAFSQLANITRLLHDIIGPVFAIALIIMLITFIKGNRFKPIDKQWIKNKGGFFGNPVSAGRYNAGEKAWYWIAMFSGILIIGSGFILDFPNIIQNRSTMELSHIIHTLTAIGLLAISFGHIYMGTIGVEGTYEAMRTGYCDENWAREHHDLWLAEREQEGTVGKTFAALKKR